MKELIARLDKERRECAASHSESTHPLGNQDLYEEAATTIRAMAAALAEWKCPGCGGAKVYTQRSRNVMGPPTVTTRGKRITPAVDVPCKVCKGSGLHPTAAALVVGPVNG